MIAEMLDRNSVPEPNSGCWIWMRGATSTGYPAWIWEGRQWRVSHLALMSKGVKVPKGFDACHTCDNTYCVNPDHLFVGTRKDNMQDAKRKSRTKGPPQKDVCLNGHEMVEPNMYVDAKGKRRCRACSEMYWRKQEIIEKAARHARGLKRRDARWGNV